MPPSIHPRVLERLEQTLRHRLADYETARQSAQDHLTDIIGRLAGLQTSPSCDTHGPLLAVLQIEALDLLRRVQEWRMPLPSESEVTTLLVRTHRLGEALTRMLPTGSDHAP